MAAITWQIATRLRTASLGDWLERIVALVAICAMAPLLAGVSFVLLATDGAPVIYRHRRIGRNGREFLCFKFRTMVRDADVLLERHLAEDTTAADEWRRTRKLKRDPRVGRIGRFLRASSLDEIPQLLNVARGEMSFVGPRPIVRQEIEKYGRHFEAYCSVKPGLTGLWQVSGRSDTSYEHRVALDVRYVQQRSLRLNARILFQTIPAVARRRGSY